jgi:hypothetical protein
MQRRAQDRPQASLATERPVGAAAHGIRHTFRWIVHRPRQLGDGAQRLLVAEEGGGHEQRLLGGEVAVSHTRVLDIIAPAGLWDFFVECGRPAPELRAPDGPELPGNLPEIVGRYRGRVLGPPPAWS